MTTTVDITPVWQCPRSQCWTRHCGNCGHHVLPHPTLPRAHVHEGTRRMRCAVAPDAPITVAAPQ